MTEEERIDAALDEIERRFATCAVCRAARARRREAGVEERARLEACCAAGDADNSCPACIAGDDQLAAVRLDEIRIVNAHPHAAVVHAADPNGGPA